MKGRDYTVTQVSFTDEGLSIQYFADDDLRVGGRVMAQHGLSLHAAHPDYKLDISTLHDVAKGILINALEDFHDSGPYKPEDDEPDSEKGMGE